MTSIDCSEVVTYIC